MSVKLGGYGSKRENAKPKNINFNKRHAQYIREPVPKV